MSELDDEHAQTRAAATAALAVSVALLIGLRRSGAISAQQLSSVMDWALSSVEQMEDDLSAQIARQLLEDVARAASQGPPKD